MRIFLLLTRISTQTDSRPLISKSCRRLHEKESLTYTITRDDFDFDIVSFLYLDCDVPPSVPHMGYTYLNSLVSPELLQILVTLTAVIKPLLLSAGKGGGGLGNGGNFGTGVRPSISKPTSFIYLAFEKKYLFIYLIDLPKC